MRRGERFRSCPASLLGVRVCVAEFGPFPPGVGLLGILGASGPFGLSGLEVPVIGGKVGFDVEKRTAIPCVDGIEMNDETFDFRDAATGEGDEIRPHGRMGSEYPRQRVLRITAGVDLEHTAPLGGVVLVEPIENVYVGESLKSIHGIPIRFEDLDPCAFVLVVNPTDRN